MPTVSVVVATYRRDDKLQRALESLLTQSDVDFEVIVVDDNDVPKWNNAVSKIIDKFKSSHPHIKIKYIQNHPSLGSARARNIGIEASESEYICFLDDDDIYLIDRIKNQMLPMIEESADYSITNLALYSESDKLIEIRNRNYIKSTSSNDLLKYHLTYHITGTDSMMFRRDYILKIGCFPHIDVGDEFYLMQKAIEGNGKFIHVPTCDIKAYVHKGDGGLSSGDNKIIGEKLLYEHKKKYFDILENKYIRYIKARHYAVMAYAEVRRNNYLCFIKHSIKSFFMSPISFFNLITKNH